MFYRVTFILSTLVFMLVQPMSAFAFETVAKQAVLIDFETRTVLMDKNSQDRMPTSSMSKVMTMYMVFDALKQGKLKLTDELPVSEKAWRMGGSKMFVEVGKKVTVEDLIRGVIVQSGNDATVVLAEALAGTEKDFAKMITEKAKELGMKSSNFVNASGWPDVNHYSTAYDLALLAYRMVEDFPEYYKYYSQEEFTYSGITQKNRNPLLYRNMGVDGIKTGHTEIAGYGLMASAKEGDRRLILVINGLESEKQRADESARVLSWAMNGFENITLFEKDDVVTEANVFMGQQKTVPLVVTKKIRALYEKANKDNLKVSVKMNEPIPAPIMTGQEVGILTVKMGNFPEKNYQLVAGASVPEIGIVGRIVQRAKSIVSGK